MTARHDAHVIVDSKAQGGFGYRVVLNGEDITDCLAADGVKIEWEGGRNHPLPTVTLKLRPGTSVDIDLPDALVSLLPADEVAQ